MSRILAIDYGQKRTGIAVTDTLQMIANGLATIETKELEKFILDYVAKEDVSIIVVGKPTQMNGENSENMKRIEPFFNRLKKLFPDKEITYYDEQRLDLVYGGQTFSVHLGEEVLISEGSGPEDYGVICTILHCVRLIDDDNYIDDDGRYDAYD